MAKNGRTLVYVRWLDASIQQHECREEDLQPGMLLESAGLLVRQDRDFISLALDWCQQDRSWRHVQHIPRVCVRAVRKVRV